MERKQNRNPRKGRTKKYYYMAAQVEHGNDRDVKKLAQSLLNEASKTRVISKQEATCQLAGLELYNCSKKVHI
jgi:hypothetical protein